MDSKKIGIVVVVLVVVVLIVWKPWATEETINYSEAKDKTSCEAHDPKGVWTDGSCSDATVKDKAACEALDPKGTWTAGSCADPAVVARAKALDGAGTKDKCLALDPKGKWLAGVAGKCSDDKGTDKAACEAITDAKWTEATKDACVEATKKADDQ